MDLNKMFFGEIKQQEQTQPKEQEQQQKQPELKQEQPWYMNHENKEQYPTLTHFLSGMHKVTRTVGKEKPDYEELEMMCKALDKLLRSEKKKNQDLTSKVKELNDFINESNHRQELSDYRKARKGVGGRKKKVIDWGKYDRLRDEGLTKEDISRVMKVSLSTLKRGLKDREKTGE